MKERIVKEQLSKSDERRIGQIARREAREIIEDAEEDFEEKIQDKLEEFLEDQDFEDKIIELMGDELDRPSKDVETNLVGIIRNVLIQFVKQLWIKRNFIRKLKNKSA